MARIPPKLLPFLHQAAFQFLAEATCGDALEHGPDLAVQVTRPGLCPKVGFGCRKLRGCPDVYRGSARLELLDSVGKCEWPRRAKSWKGGRAQGAVWCSDSYCSAPRCVACADLAPAIVACLGFYCFCRCRLTASFLVRVIEAPDLKHSRKQTSLSFPPPGASLSKKSLTILNAGNAGIEDF